MRQHYVTFTYQTMADTPKEALANAKDALANDNGGWIEVSSERPDGDTYDVIDGDLAEVIKTDLA